jgi:L-glutamine:2-deoxy-scyllo-inosose/3-amino-2,3-dideoxy-scyllo-inosose aminotransferase
MPQLACLGGNPVTGNLISEKTLKTQKELERQYLLDVHASEIWDDWPGVNSMAAKFEKEWAEFNQSKHAALLTNGTHTLQVALESLGIGYGDEVIVPGLTWQATASAVCDVNAVPVLVDLEPDTFCIDPALVEAAITPKTRAIIPVHLYHRLADLDRLLAIAKKYKLYFIEDCAHTHGSRWNNQPAGTFGEFGSFSFQSSKLVTSGEGGALLMQDEALYWKVVSQRSCGREFKPEVKVHSGNYRMTGFQAAILRAQVAAHAENAALIDRNGLALDRAIDAAPGVKALRRHPKITRQCSYCFAFLYDSATYDGLPAADFRKALTAECGVDFFTTYTPLSHSEVYYPHTKKRHQLNPEYVAAITPSRWQLPVADDLWANQAVLALWKIFQCAPEKAHLVTDAITKIYANRHELLAAIR